MKIKSMKFANAASARTHGAAMVACGEIYAYCEYKSGKNYILRVIKKAGGTWSVLAESAGA